MKNLVLLCIPCILAGFVRGSMKDPICGLPPGVSGPCYASMPSFTYYPIFNACMPFHYGGCQGNENKFMSKELCEEKCKK